MGEINESKTIEFPVILTVRDLAAKMSASPIQVIKILMSNGVMANINQQVDFDTAAIVASELGFEAVQEAALEDVVAGAIFAVYPPGEVEQKLVEHAFEPFEIALAMTDLLQAAGEHRGMSVYWRVDVVVVKLLGPEHAGDCLAHHIGLVGI